MTEPDAVTGVVGPPTSADVSRALRMLEERQSALLDTIVAEKKVASDAMANVKSAREELATVERLLRAQTPRKASPRKPKQ